MKIRVATPADAEAMIHAHYAAVHETAGAFYLPKIIDAWSGNPDEVRYQWMRQVITQAEHIALIAEDEPGVSGFGIVILPLSELRALYVHPVAGRKGVGKQLLAELEARAINQGISCLHLNASVNAERFYQRNGYQPLSRGTLRLSDEYEMECIKMEKRL